MTFASKAVLLRLPLHYFAQALRWEVMERMSDQTTEEAQELKLGNDTRQLEALFKAHYADLCRTAYRLLKDEDAAEDIVQEVFLKLWNQKDELVINTSPKAYLARAVSNASLNYLERHKRQVNMEPEDFSAIMHVASEVEDGLHYQELENSVSEAIDALPPRCKAVYVLSRYEDKSYKEIAEDLDISVKTVENQMGKALKDIRSYLTRFGF